MIGRNFYQKIVGLSLLLIISLFVSACGGGSTDSDKKDDKQKVSILSGTAATSAPIVGSILVTDSAGVSASTNIETNGSYSVSVANLAPPFIISADPSDENLPTQYSFASQTNITVNVTPLSTLMLFNANNQQDLAELESNWVNQLSNFTQTLLDEQRAIIDANFSDLFVAENIPANFNYVNSSFDTDQMGFDKFLSKLSVTLDSSSNTFDIQFDGETFVFNTIPGTSGDIDLGSGALSVTIFDDFYTKMPLSGVYVSIYEADNKTIAETQQTDSNGRVVFNANSNSVDEARYTVTVAYVGSPGENREIQTIFNVLADDYTLFMEEDSTCVEQGLITASFTVADAQMGADAVGTLDPLGLSSNGFSGIQSFLNTTTVVMGGSANYTDATVCLEDIQSNGKLTLLNLVNTTSEFNTELNNYGFLVDQDFNVNGSNSYAGASDLQPSSLSWMSTTERNPNIVNVSAVRQGVNYGFLGFDVIKDESFGSFPFADKFPADAFRVLFASDMDGYSCISQRKYDTAPMNIEVTFPDYSIAGFAYDSSSETFSWEVMGNSPIDQVIISSKFGDTRKVEWDFIMPSSRSTVLYPDLPAEVQAWFNREDFIPEDAEITVTDVTPLSGFDSILKLAYASNKSLFDFDGFDSCSLPLVAPDVGLGGGVDTGGVDTGGVDTGGVDTGGADNVGLVEFSGSSVSVLPSGIFVPAPATSGQFGFIWEDSDGTLLSAVIGDGNIFSLSVISSNGDSWNAFTFPVVGVVVMPNSLIFTDAELTDSAGGSLLLNGELAY